MNGEVKVKDLRIFGLLVGGVFEVIAFWPMVWRGEGLRLWAVGLGTILVLLGLAAPRGLTPAYRGWKAVGHVLGKINTKILLGIVFFGIVTPTAVVIRALKRDPLRRTCDPNLDTYRVPRSEREGAHLYRQY